MAGLAVGAAVGAAVRGAAPGGDPNAACAGCHQAIYERYRSTPMANASGPARKGFLAAEYYHAPSQVTYRIAETGGRVQLEMERPAIRFSGRIDGISGMTAPALDARRELEYFIGSGLRGRTYLFAEEGYWFEAPINWYGKKRVWDMAPNFLETAEIPLTLPVDPGCLRCHSSGARAAQPEARNKYAAEPFVDGGITCAACHGDGSAHVASGGQARMMDIDGLAPERRDSVCLSCHLEGQAAIVRRGKRLEDFRPGESIWDYATYFVHANDRGSGGRATSQWEALLGSACKRGSGERMTCTTCHDPHGTETTMSRAEKVAYYRQRCLACHETPATVGKASFSATHHAENQDCTACHMQRASSTDIAHEQVTDHRIVVRFSGKVIPPATTGALVAVGPAAISASAEERDLGLAYAQMAARGDRAAFDAARLLLGRAEKRAGAEQDEELDAQLGFLDQVAGQSAEAAREYKEALIADSENSFAAGNLAMLLARNGDPRAAVELWRRALAEDPAQATSGINLAIVECGLGSREDALATLGRVLEFSPDNRQALGLELSIRAKARACGR